MNDSYFSDSCLIIKELFRQTNNFKRSCAPYVLPCASRACRAIDSPGTSYSPFPTFTHSHTYARAHARTHTTGMYTRSQRRRCKGGVRRRSNRPPPRSTPAPSLSSSHSNRIVSIINETALGFSGEPRFRVTGFRISVRPCVYRTRGCVRDAPYLFTHAVEYNCHRAEESFLATRNTHMCVATSRVRSRDQKLDDMNSKIITASY